MKDRGSVRKMMVVAGLLAAMTIALSPAFQQETARVMMEIKADAEQTDEAKLSAVSTEALTSPQAVEVESANPFMIQEIIAESNHPSPVTFPVAQTVTALTTLLRSVISPQAP